MDIPLHHVPYVPDPTTVPPGSKLLVKVRRDRDEEATRIDIALAWTQKGETFWLLDMERLNPDRVLDALLLTPDAPFGATPWGSMARDEQARLYMAALQALCARPSFERTVADSWVRAAMKLDGNQESNSASLVNRLRRDAMADARATIADRLASNVDVDGIVKSIDPTKTMLEWLRNPNWDGGKSKVWALIKERIDARLNDAVRAELDARLGDTFEYLRKSMGMAVNNAIGRMGAAKAATGGSGG